MGRRWSWSLRQMAACVVMACVMAGLSTLVTAEGRPNSVFDAVSKAFVARAKRSLAQANGDTAKNVTSNDQNNTNVDKSYGITTEKPAATDLASAAPQDTATTTTTASPDQFTPVTPRATATTTTSPDKARVYGRPGCHAQCTCPDRVAMSQLLVPFLRLYIGSAADQYSDQTLQLFLQQKFEQDPESVTSSLSRINVWMAQNKADQRLTSLFEAARFGVTLCWVRAGNPFVLDAASEAILFPQARGADLAQSESTSTISPQNASRMDSKETLAQHFATSQLYNVSFICTQGNKVVIKRDVTLRRYGRWKQVNCDVTTEAPFYVESEMSLVVLLISGSTASWLRNVSVNADTSGKDQTGNEPDVSVINRTDSLQSVKRTTLFPNVRQVTISNTSLSVPELSNVLSWFQKATDLDLKNNSLGDFHCQQLLPSAAAWNDLTLSGNGLHALPVCTLRPSVEQLDLSDNAISDITPLQFPRVVPAPRLKLLYLQNNNISDLGVLSDMPKLTILQLANNHISRLHKLSFNRLPELASLDLSGNALTVLEPGTFKALHWLMELDLRHNFLTTFDRTVSPIRLTPNDYVCKVYLNNNLLSHPPFQRDRFRSSGFVVSAGDNPYQCDCAVESYTELFRSSSTVNSRDGVNDSVLAQTMFPDRDTMVCQYPAQLAGQPLDTMAFTDTCPVVTDCPANCTCSLSRNTSVVTVDCVPDGWSRLPGRLPDTYPLQINIRTTGVSLHPLQFTDSKYLGRVVEINMSGIGLTQLPDFLCEAMPQVRLIDVSHNQLSRVPECLKTRNELFSSVELRLAGNPIACNCDNVWLPGWLAGMLGTQVVNTTAAKSKVIVTDAEEVYCSAETRTLVAHWDTDDCYPFNYLPLVVTLGVVLAVAMIAGPVLYVYRLKAVVAIHAHLHVRPFAHARHLNEADYDHEALIVHGDAEQSLLWVLNVFLPRMEKQRHRLCIPERDFSIGACIADSYAEAVARSKATICLLTARTVQEEWWRFAFQVARAQNARRPQNLLLLVLLEHVREEDMPTEVQGFLQTNTYLSADDKWFWKKLLYYLPDPPPQ